MLLIEQMEIEVSTQTVIFDDGKNQKGSKSDTRKDGSRNAIESWDQQKHEVYRLRAVEKKPVSLNR